MKKRNLSFLSNDGITKIHAVCWMPDGEYRKKPKAVVQLVHGMVEYIERYDAFATYLTEQGIVVVGHDHLGHGQSVTSVEKWGYIAEDNPAGTLIKDMHKLRLGIQKSYKGVPYIMLGHSMGSYLLRRYLSVDGPESTLDGAIIVGTGSEPDTITKPALTLVRGMAKAKGWDYRSEQIRDLTYNGPYKKYDCTGEDITNSWVCSDPEIMAKYYSDERCTFLFTLNGYEALLSTVMYDNNPKKIDKIKKTLPILITSGELDPVGNMGKGVKDVYKKFVKAGIQDVECKLYPNDRHEILNEKDKYEVYADIYAWIEKHL